MVQVIKCAATFAAEATREKRDSCALVEIVMCSVRMCNIAVVIFGITS